jgi:hypothetical protein
MNTPVKPSSTAISAAYAALRHGGEPPGRARQHLGLAEDMLRRLERQFQATTARSGINAMLPKFADHRGHIAAVRRAGGFPALPPSARR